MTIHWVGVSVGLYEIFSVKLLNQSLSLVQCKCGLRRSSCDRSTPKEQRCTPVTYAPTLLHISDVSVLSERDKGLIVSLSHIDNLCYVLH